MVGYLGPFETNRVTGGDSLDLIPELPRRSVDVVVTSPPYWGQRVSKGTGTEEDPRDYLAFLTSVFQLILPKLKDDGIVWINLGDAYNTPVNWREADHVYSSLGAEKNGLSPHNSAYVKPRGDRKAFLDEGVPWLRYGNLLGLTYRLVTGLCDSGYVFRGEVIWRKRNAMPEGRCRRPHRQHEPIYLFAKSDRHSFRVSPPVKSVWEFANEQIEGTRHFSRFPIELPLRCIEALGRLGPDVLVFDPFSGSGTTGMAAKRLNCTYVGFEIDPDQVEASNRRLCSCANQELPLLVR